MYLKSAEDAKEIVQDVFIEIWVHRSEIDESQSFSGYLFTIAKHKILNLIRKKTHQNTYIKQLGKSTDNNSNFTEIEVFTKDYETLLNVEIEKLPPKRRVIFELSRKEGLTYTEIAKKLDISVKTVENQMIKALEHFRRRFGRELFRVILTFSF